MSTKKFNGLELWSEKNGSNYYVRCKTDTGETLSFPYSISKGIRELLKEIELILSEQDWRGLTKDTVTENHLKTYLKAKRVNGEWE